MSEVWTAVRKEVTEQGTLLIFEVKDSDTNEVREETRYESGLPLMVELGGYSPVMGAVLLMTPLPWRFRKVGDNIYLDGPSIDVEGYHPIGEV